MRFLAFLIFNIVSGSVLLAQTTIVEGFVFEKNNRGYIKNAKVAALDTKTEVIKGETTTDQEGFFSFELAQNVEEYIIVANHRDFMATEVTIKPKENGQKNFAKIEMERKPGYVFDVTVAEDANPSNGESVDAIEGALIEVYNNTTKTEELVLENHPHPTFNFNFLPGNHYTIMIRKKGYLAKRVEAYVDVDGCILCFDGLGDVTPNVTDVMTNSNQLGTFLSNVELEKIVIEKTFKIENIYYDYDKWFIRPDAAIELDKVVQLLKENPSITVELGSHTDSRGKDAYNMSLSDKRAAAAVQYIVNEGGIAAKRLQSRGYGESVLANRCSNGVQCSEQEHQFNRRTELKITGIDKSKETIFVPLKRIIEEDALLEEVLNSEEIRVVPGDTIPKELRSQLHKDNGM